MINKIYKRIHNKYLNYIKFFFFLRYVITIFLIATASFLLIPKFLNYEKRLDAINEYLLNNYDLRLIRYSAIKYNIFPLPNLSIQNINSKIQNNNIDLKSNNIIIFLDLKNIYDYNNFKARKILLIGNDVSIDIVKIDNLFNYYNKLKSKLAIKELNIFLRKDKNPLLEVKNINFFNYGYLKHRIRGEVFGKKFKTSVSNENNDINFKILNTGVKASINFNKNNVDSFLSGTSKIILSNNLIKFNFILNNNNLKITKSYFRNKNLTLTLDSFIKFNPFFNIDSKIEIKEINNNLIDDLSLDKILKNRNFIKKINSKINVYFKSKKYFGNLIESYSSDLHFEHGRLNFINKILIPGGKIECQGNSLLIDEYPRLNFKCLLSVKDKKKLFKKFSLTNISNDKFNIDIEGSLNLLNKKINFISIQIENRYLANEEDKIYFKQIFEKTLFDEEFFKLFNKKKIKNFILEII